MNHDDRPKDAQSVEPDAELLELLSAAYDPSDLEASVNADLIEQVLSSMDSGDTVATPGSAPEPYESQDRPQPTATEKELAAADEFRAALDGERDHPWLELVGALRAAYDPAELSADFDTKAAVRRGEWSRVYALPRRIWPYSISILAAAAAAAFWIGTHRISHSTIAGAETSTLAQSRSLSPLFAETLEPATPTERIDRIYAVRSKELRQNRFATWRVR